MEAKEFGAYLKNLRNEKNLTLTELGDQIGLSNPYLSQIENGKKGIPSPELLRKLADGLGVSHTALLLKAGHLNDSLSAMQRYYIDILSGLAKTISFIDEDETGSEKLLEQRKRAEDKFGEVMKELEEQIKTDIQLSEEELELQNKYVSGEINNDEYERLMKEHYDIPNLEKEVKDLLDKSEESEKQVAETEEFLETLVDTEHDLLEFLGKEKVSFMGKEISNSDKLKITRVIASILIDHAPDQTDLVVHDFEKERRIIIDFQSLVNSKKN